MALTNSFPIIPVVVSDFSQLSENAKGTAPGILSQFNTSLFLRWHKITKYILTTVIRTNITKLIPALANT